MSKPDVSTFVRVSPDGTRAYLPYSDDTSTRDLDPNTGLPLITSDLRWYVREDIGRNEVRYQVALQRIIQKTTKKPLKRNWWGKVVESETIVKSEVYRDVDYYHVWPQNGVLKDRAILYAAIKILDKIDAQAAIQERLAINKSKLGAYPPKSING